MYGRMTKTSLKEKLIALGLILVVDIIFFHQSTNAADYTIGSRPYARPQQGMQQSIIHIL